jgi:hypothetical protein
MIDGQKPCNISRCRPVDNGPELLDMFWVTAVRGSIISHIMVWDSVRVKVQARKTGGVLSQELTSDTLRVPWRSIVSTRRMIVSQTSAMRHALEMWQLKCSCMVCQPCGCTVFPGVRNWDWIAVADAG